MGQVHDCASYWPADSYSFVALSCVIVHFVLLAHLIRIVARGKMQSSPWRSLFGGLRRLRLEFKGRVQSGPSTLSAVTADFGTGCGSLSLN